MTLEEINLKMQQIRNKIEPLEDELQDLHVQKQKVCPHTNIEYSSSWTDSEYCGPSTYYPAFIKCHDCGLYIGDGSGLFYKLKKEHNIN